VVLGFPSNDFAQETGSNKEIADFCENTFGVKFPMFGKSAVRGSDANPLFRNWRRNRPAPLWNFHKYLVGRDGKVVAQYSSMTKPDDKAFVGSTERQLAAPSRRRNWSVPVSGLGAMLTKLYRSRPPCPGGV
jgi:glutathione peroxidase